MRTVATTDIDMTGTDRRETPRMANALTSFDVIKLLAKYARQESWPPADPAASSACPRRCTLAALLAELQACSGPSRDRPDSLAVPDAPSPSVRAGRRQQGR